MKNKEIEELLNELKDVAERHTIEIREYGVVETIPQSISKELRLNSYSANLLLSYIEQLEKLCNKYEQEHKTTFEIWKEDIEKLKQLENNRDKAIEYIESHFIFNDKTGECYQTHTFDKDNVKKLYNILKGDSDD